jgi:hypothetical protein
MLNHMAITLDNLGWSVGDTDPREVDYLNHVEDVRDMKKSLAEIRKFLTKVEEQG